MLASCRAAKFTYNREFIHERMRDLGGIIIVDDDICIHNIPILKLSYFYYDFLFYTTHRRRSQRRGLRKDNIGKPTSCGSADFPTDSRAAFSSSASSRPRSRGRCRGPSSGRESSRPPIPSTANAVYRKKLPESWFIEKYIFNY